MLKVNETVLDQIGLNPDMFYIGMKAVGHTYGFKFSRYESDYGIHSILIYYKPNASKEKILEMAASVEEDVSDCALVAI